MSEARFLVAYLHHALDAQLDMEITSEPAPMGQKGLPPSYNVTPFSPTHHMRNGILSFTEVLLSNVEEWSKPITPLPPPPPPIAFSGSDRFIKGRLPHRTLSISASLSSLFDEAMPILSDLCKNGDAHAGNAIVKTQTMIHEEMQSGDDRTPASSTHFNPVIHTDNAQNSDATAQVLFSNGTVACSIDNFLEAKATCPKAGRSLSANDTADVATCDADNLLQDATQHAHGSDGAMFHNLFEDDGWAQPLDKDGASEAFGCSLSTTKELEGSVCVSDKILSGLHVNNDGGGKTSTKTLVDVSLGQSLLVECESSLSSPILRCDDADRVAELPLPSLSINPNDNNLTGHTYGAPQLSPTKCLNDNNLTYSLPSIAKCSAKIDKGDTCAVSELFLPSYTKSRDDNKSVGNADVVINHLLSSVMNSVEIVTPAEEGLSQLSLPSPQKSNNATNLRGNVDGAADLHSQPLPKSHDVNGLHSAVMEDPIALQQDEQVQVLEEGELSERLSGDECLEMSEDGTSHGECESHLPSDKVFESSTDDEMNQPISLFISRYRTRSSINTSTQKMPPVDTDSNIKTKGKTGKKRKFEEQERSVKEVINMDMAGKAQLKQAKGGQKRPSKVARVLDNSKGGGLLEVASKVSGVSKIGTGEAKVDAENQHVELSAARDRGDQEGSMILHPSQAEVETQKPNRRRVLTAERKKKRKLQKHRKAYERVAGKIRVKPCIEKQKEKKHCYHYARGRCDKGASCPFSHDITPITKSEMCKYFINNCCLKGDDCPFSHALSTFPCKYFHTRGRCMGADSCRFSHEPLSEEAKQKLLARIDKEQQGHEGHKATDRDSLGRVNSKHSVLPSDLEVFPLGGKRGNKMPLKVTGSAASKIRRFDTTATRSMRNNTTDFPMLGMAKKAASTFIGGDTSVKAAHVEVNKSMLGGSFLDPTGILADRSSAIGTAKSATRETGLPVVQTAGFLRDSTTAQERKTKVGAFLQEQLDTSHLMRKSKLGTGSESSGGCYTLLNQPRALSMGQTSVSKLPSTSPSGDPNAKAMMGSPYVSVGRSDSTPTSKSTTCIGNKPKSNSLNDQGKGVSNGESAGINASVPNPSFLGPSLLDLVSMPQRATFPKGPTASTAGLLSPTIDATPKRSTASVFLDRFLKA